jgi:glutamate-1-semialdehyde 2,1-aminomutase
MPGYHDALRELTRRTGTLLIIDETHTISAGPGGYTRAYGLEPDMFVIGKPIGSGLPGATYGFTEDVAARITARMELDVCDTGGIGGTLAGNALSAAAMRATLEHVLTDTAFAHMIAMGDRFTDGVRSVIAERGLPWHVSQLGCRAEYLFRPTPPHTGAEAAAAANGPLDHFLHLYMLNRGILMTPFHNMALSCAATVAADVDAHTEIFADAVERVLESA